MIAPVRLVVMGAPEPQGSMKIVPLRRRFPLTIHSFRELLTSVAVTSDNAELKAWRRTIARAAKDAMLGDKPYAGPVAVEVTFYLPPPAKIPKERGGYPIARGSGDCDKHVRACFDALSNVAYQDDVQVVDIIARKRYAETPAHARAEITVRPIAIGLALEAERIA